MAINALVCRVTHFTPIPGKDKIQLAWAEGNQVIISKDIPLGTLGIFFPPEAQLSHEFCYENSLYASGKGENKDPSASGYIQSTRRIKQLVFKDAISSGLWMPLTCLSYLGNLPIPLKEGDTFSSLAGHEICNRYITPLQAKSSEPGLANQTKVKPEKIKYPEFKEHYDTPNLRYYINSIPIGATCIWTVKMHGTSGRTGLTKVVHPIKGWRRLWNKYLGKLYTFSPEVSYDKVTGTRRTIVKTSRTQKQDGWYKHSFREVIHEALSPRLGETLYYEIVGWAGGAPIQPGVDLQDKTDPVKKQLRKLLKTDYMDWSYGHDSGTYGVYVYRITQVDDTGEVNELSWEQVQARCKELGVPTVPYIKTTTFTSAEELLQELETHCSQPDPTNPHQITEGVCIRVVPPDTRKSSYVYKYKGNIFNYLEGRMRDIPTFIDIEETV